MPCSMSTASCSPCRTTSSKSFPHRPGAGAWYRGRKTPACSRVIGARPMPSARAAASAPRCAGGRSEEHTSELQSQSNLVCRLLLEKKNRAPRVAGEPGRVVAEARSAVRPAHRPLRFVLVPDPPPLPACAQPVAPPWLRRVGSHAILDETIVRGGADRRSRRDEPDPRRHGRALRAVVRRVAVGGRQGSGRRGIEPGAIPRQRRVFFFYEQRAPRTLPCPPPGPSPV